MKQLFYTVFLSCVCLLGSSCDNETDKFNAEKRIKQQQLYAKLASIDNEIVHIAQQLSRTNRTATNRLHTAVNNSDNIMGGVAIIDLLLTGVQAVDLEQRRDILINERNKVIRELQYLDNSR